MTKLLSIAKVNAALDMLSKGTDLNRYCHLQSRLYETNVYEDDSYRKTYHGLYKLRGKCVKWRDTYFRLLQNSKNDGIDFPTTLRHLHEQEGGYDASFASKLVATIDPKQPVWDSVVLRNLELPFKKYSQEEEHYINVYFNLMGKVSCLRRSDDGKRAIKMFRDKFPDAVPKITNTKIIDFILWQSREKKKK